MFKPTRRVELNVILALIVVFSAPLSAHAEFDLPAQSKVYVQGMAAAGVVEAQLQKQSPDFDGCKVLPLFDGTFLVLKKGSWEFRDVTFSDLQLTDWRAFAINKNAEVYAQTHPELGFVTGVWTGQTADYGQKVAGVIFIKHGAAWRFDVHEDLTREYFNLAPGQGNIQGLTWNWKNSLLHTKEYGRAMHPEYTVVFPGLQWQNGQVRHYGFSPDHSVIIGN